MTTFFDVFQLSLLVLFLILFVGRTLMLRLRNGVRVLVLGAGKRGARRLVELSLMIGLVLWITAVFSQSLGLLPRSWNPVLLDAFPVRIVGASLVCLGFVVFIWALASFGSSWRIGVDTERTGALVTTGAFRHSRNPVFLFIDFYLVGTAFIYTTPFFIAFAIFGILEVHYQIRQEEKFLGETYGQLYLDYCRITPRYLGTVKGRNGGRI